MNEHILVFENKKVTKQKEMQDKNISENVK